MREININLNVRIGTTEALDELLNAFGCLMAARQGFGSPQSPLFNARVQGPETASEADRVKIPATEQAPVTAEAKQDEVAADEPPAKGAEEQRDLTVKDVRDCIERTRRRIEGADYENSDSEGRKKWHKQLTNLFLQISATLGADKPSKLPDHNSRCMFIEECARIMITPEGLVTDKPF